MAFRKTLAQRFLSISKPSTPPQSIIRSRSSANPSLLQRLLQSPPQSEQGLLRWVLLQSRSIFQSSSISPERLSLPIGDKLIERLRGLNRDRIRLDVLAPPPIPPDRKEDATEAAPISVEEVRKVLRVSRAEEVKARLRGSGKSSISYSEFVRICCEGSSREKGLGLARALDESGEVLVLGNVVFLRPDQVARAIERVIPLSLAREDDPRREELREMEQRKVEIDGRAEVGVRRELWCGLAFLVAQTAGFMRLTFWDLSWDVMEPICFYVTSAYFMTGYAFFLRTSRDPSFEGFFESRFIAKQCRLMRAANFDLRRLHELRGAFPTTDLLEFSYPSSSSSSAFPCDCPYHRHPHHHHHRRDTLFGAVH